MEYSSWTWRIIVSLLFINQATCFVRVCYFTNWSQDRPGTGRFVPEDIDPFLCSHLVYAYAWLSGNQLVPTHQNDESTGDAVGFYEQLTNLKNINPELKVLLAVGGWNAGSLPFSNMVSSGASRQEFINSTIDYLRTHDFDGIDLDWEFPGRRRGRTTDKDNLNKLLIEMRKGFEDESIQTGNETLLITAVVPPGRSFAQSGYDVPVVVKNLDFIHVMTYDYHGAWESKLGHPSPLYPRLEERGDEAMRNMEESLLYWLSMGVPKEKLVASIALYGRSFTLMNNQNHRIGDLDNGTGPMAEYTQEPGFIAYYEICDLLNKGAARYWHDEQKVPYLVNGSTWIGYDDASSIELKMRMLKEMGIGGVMIWALDLDDFTGSFCNQGTSPLLTTINLKLIDLKFNIDRNPFGLTRASNGTRNALLNEMIDNQLGTTNTTYFYKINDTLTQHSNLPIEVQNMASLIFDVRDIIHKKQQTNSSNIPIDLTNDLGNNTNTFKNDARVVQTSAIKLNSKKSSIDSSQEIILFSPPASAKTSALSTSSKAFTSPTSTRLSIPSTSAKLTVPSTTAKLTIASVSDESSIQSTSDKLLLPSISANFSLQSTFEKLSTPSTSGRIVLPSTTDKLSIPSKSMFSTSEKLIMPSTSEKLSMPSTSLTTEKLSIPSTSEALSISPTSKKLYLPAISEKLFILPKASQLSMTSTSDKSSMSSTSTKLSMTPTSAKKSMSLTLDESAMHPKSEKISNSSTSDRLSMMSPSNILSITSTSNKLFVPSTSETTSFPAKSAQLSTSSTSAESTSEILFMPLSTTTSTRQTTKMTASTLSSAHTFSSTTIVPLSKKPSFTQGSLLDNMESDLVLESTSKIKSSKIIKLNPKRAKLQLTEKIQSGVFAPSISFSLDNSLSQKPIVNSVTSANYKKELPIEKALPVWSVDEPAIFDGNNWSTSTEKTVDVYSQTEKSTIRNIGDLQGATDVSYSIGKVDDKVTHAQKAPRPDIVSSGESHIDTKSSVVKRVDNIIQIDFNVWSPDTGQTTKDLPNENTKDLIIQNNNLHATKTEFQGKLDGTTMIETFPNRHGDQSRLNIVATSTQQGIEDQRVSQTSNDDNKTKEQLNLNTMQIQNDQSKSLESLDARKDLTTLLKDELRLSEFMSDNTKRERAAAMATLLKQKYPTKFQQSDERIMNDLLSKVYKLESTNTSTQVVNVIPRSYDITDSNIKGHHDLNGNSKALTNVHLLNIDTQKQINNIKGIPTHTFFSVNQNQRTNVATHGATSTPNSNDTQHLSNLDGPRIQEEFMGGVFAKMDVSALLKEEMRRTKHLSDIAKRRRAVAVVKLLKQMYPSQFKQSDEQVLNDFLRKIYQLDINVRRPPQNDNGLLNTDESQNLNGKSVAQANVQTSTADTQLQNKRNALQGTLINTSSFTTQNQQNDMTTLGSKSNTIPHKIQNKQEPSKQDGPLVNGSRIHNSTLQKFNDRKDLSVLLKEEMRRSEVMSEKAKKERAADLVKLLKQKYPSKFKESDKSILTVILKKVYQLDLKLKSRSYINSEKIIKTSPKRAKLRLQQRVDEAVFTPTIADTTGQDSSNNELYSYNELGIKQNEG